ncbi:non-ribosomal peptide synthase [Fusarium sp. NRRL 25303]|nr:non-ribosomal peptide synthase [Fusarium sp. NRRL 25303]
MPSNTLPPNLWTTLNRAASGSPSRGLFFIKDSLQSDPTYLAYSELVTIASRNASQLRATGLVEPNQIVLLSFADHYEHVIWIWSVIAAGGVPAALPPPSNDAVTQSSREDYLDDLFGTPLLLTSTSHPVHVGYCRVTDVSTIDKLKPVKGDESINDGMTAESSSTGLLFFTSGSTGQPKAIEISHKQVITSAAAKISLHQTTSATRFLNWVSFDHSACFAEIHLQAVIAGADQWNVARSIILSDPSNLYRLLDCHKINYTFSPCSILRAATSEMGNLEQSVGLNLSHLQVVMVGGESNSVSSLRQANLMMKKFGARGNPIKAAYGLSETCSACFYNLEDELYDSDRCYQFATVGKHLPDVMSVRLVDERGRVVKPGSQGTIQMKGDIVFKRYYNNKAATAACMTVDGWFNTEDLGRLNSDGNLEIVGRIKDLLIVNGNKYSPSALEHAIELQHPLGVAGSYTAVFVVPESLNQPEGVVILFNPTRAVVADQNLMENLLASISRTCLRFCSKLPVDIIPLPIAMLPKSTIGKLSRSSLRMRYLDRSFECYRISSGEAPQGVLLQSPLAKRIGFNISKITGIPASKIDYSSSITHKGLDSLHYMKMQHDITKFLGIDKLVPLAVFFEASNIGELEASLTKFMNGDNTYKCCVALREAGSKIPVFCIHAGDGVITHFLTLLDYFPDRPFYAFQAKGRSQGETTFNSMDEMVSCYYTALRERQPEGPYILLGYCFGGVIGFELAKRLEKEGHRVAFCGGIDSTPTTYFTDSSGWTAQDFAVDLLLLLGLIQDDEVGRLRESLDTVPDDRLDLVYSIIESKYQSPSFIESGLSVTTIETWRNLQRSMLDMSQDTALHGSICSYDCFYVMSGDITNGPSWLDSVRIWRQFADKVTLWEIDGTHYTTLKEPHVKRLHHCMTKAFARANI